jgi:hypothetical protein
MADPLDVWHWRNPVPTGNHISQVVYVNGGFMATDGAGEFLLSSNELGWHNSQAPTLSSHSSMRARGTAITAFIGDKVGEPARLSHENPTDMKHIVFVIL